MNARGRDRRVLIEKKGAAAQGSDGEPSAPWVPAFTGADGKALELWAAKLEGRALEKFAAQQRIAQTAAVFSLAWAPANTIDPATHRLTYDGRRYDITGVVEQGRREGIALMCEAVANAPRGPDVRP